MTSDVKIDDVTGLPEIDYDGLSEAEPSWERLCTWVEKWTETVFNAGRQSVLTEGAARTALLEAQSRWLDQADSAETTTLRTLARVMADAFAQEAARYKTNQVEGFDVDKIIKIVEDDSE